MLDPKDRQKKLSPIAALKALVKKLRPKKRFIMQSFAPSWEAAKADRLNRLRFPSRKARLRAKHARAGE